MRRRDYMLRLIEEFGQVIAAIHRTILARQDQAAERALEEAYRQLLGGDFSNLPTRLPAELFTRLTFGESPDTGRDKCVWLAAALCEEGQLRAAQKQEFASYRCYVQALQILLLIGMRFEFPTMIEDAPTVVDLLSRLSPYQLPSTTLALLVDYYAHVGAYGQAEDVLFDLVEVEHDVTQLQTFGIAFYERLLQLSDAELQAGNLPRSEVTAGLAAFRARGGPSA